MALESPLIHDGGQMVSVANFFNPVSALQGPGGSGQFLGVVISAARTLSIASVQGSIIYGVLQNTPPAANEACDVGILGISKMVAGAAVAAGAELMVDSSGRFITWVAGAGNAKVGMALEAATALGSVFSGLVYSPNIRLAGQ